MTASPHAPEYRLQSPDGRLAIVYQWKNDRFIHQILLDGDLKASSIDGDASEAWPSSPPIQQISLESIQGVPTILGVGSAGRGHWSISVDWSASEASSANDSAGNDSAGHFRFDMACRSKDPPEFLGSSYHGITESQTNLMLQMIVGNRRSDGDQTVLSPVEQQANEITYRWVYTLGLLGQEVGKRTDGVTGE